VVVVLRWIVMIGLFGFDDVCRRLWIELIDVDIKLNKKEVSKSLYLYQNNHLLHSAFHNFSLI
jgi:hypothetical protein